MGQAQVAEGLSRVEAALRGEARPRTYAIQAAIAALHMRAERYEDTDWPQIAALYEVLMRTHPSPVIELNHAVAVSMVDGPERALRLVDTIEKRGELDGYHALPAVRATSCAAWAGAKRRSQRTGRPCRAPTSNPSGASSPRVLAELG